MKKIGIWGYFGYRNCGDDLLLLNVVNEVTKYADDNTEITVFGDSKNIKRLFLSDKIKTRKRSAKELLKFSLESDLIIVGPGGIFPSQNSKKLLFYLLITIIMKIRKRMTTYIGIGIGMFQRRIDIWLINRITALANIFVSRSKNYLSFESRLKINRILLSSDMILSDPIICSSTIDTNCDFVVIALANIFESNTNEYKNIFISEILPFLQHIVDKGFKVKLVSFTNEKDMNLNNIIAKHMKSDSVVSVPFHENPYDTFNEIKNATICIGMRFHALVMSLAKGIPCISISYSDKNEDLMQRFNLSQYSVRFGISKYEYYNKEIMIKHSQLINAFDKLCNEKEKIKSVISAKQPFMNELSQINRKEICLLMIKLNNGKNNL